MFSTDGQIAHVCLESCHLRFLSTSRKVIGFY